MYSIIDPMISITEVTCVVSVVCDNKARHTDDNGGFVILESLKEGKRIIKTFEFMIDKNGVGTVNCQTYANVGEFKQAMQEKDCRACTFGTYNPKTVEETLKQPFDPSAVKGHCPKEKDPSFFKSGSRHDEPIRTSFDWARIRALATVTDLDIRSHLEEQISDTIDIFIRQSTPIEYLSSSVRCLIM